MSTVAVSGFTRTRERDTTDGAALRAAPYEKAIAKAEVAKDPNLAVFRQHRERVKRAARKS